MRSNGSLFISVGNTKQKMSIQHHPSLRLAFRGSREEALDVVKDTLSRNQASHLDRIVPTSVKLGQM